MTNFFDYDTAKAIYYVYLYKNITKAGDKLGLTQSAMSRRVQMAEERTGLLIFERGFHEMVPTKQGARYIESCKEILHIGDAALKDAHALVGTPKNELRILSTPSLACTMLPPMIRGYEKQHPNVRLKIKASPDILSVLDADIVISPYFLDDDEAKHVKLYDMIQGIYATREYLDEFGMPESLHDLKDHRLLTIDPENYPAYRDINWLLSYGIVSKNVQREPYMEFNANDGKIRAMLAGYGITTCSELHLQLLGATNAVRILPEIEECAKGIYFITNKRARPRKEIEDLYKAIVKNLKLHGIETKFPKQ